VATAAQEYGLRKTSYQLVWLPTTWPVDNFAITNSIHIRVIECR
jgi:hypothetical protein